MRLYSLLNLLLLLLHLLLLLLLILLDEVALRHYERVLEIEEHSPGLFANRFYSGFIFEPFHFERTIVVEVTLNTKKSTMSESV